MTVRLPGACRLPHPVEGLLLDACNILYDDTAWRRWLLRLLGRLGLATSYRSFFRVWERDYLDDVHAGRRGFAEALVAFLLAAGLSPGQVEEVEVASRAHRRLLEEDLRPLTGVPGTLRRLGQSGVALGVIANSEVSTAALRARLERLGIGTLLGAVVSSQDLGEAMPDQACYQRALAEMGLPAEQVAFVGHDARQLAGAATAGMQTIAFNSDTDARADAYLARFDALVELVGPSRPLAAAG